jgi:hypothetical protein
MRNLGGRDSLPKTDLPRRAALSIFKQIRLFYLCYFSKPQPQRVVYRSIRRNRARKIVELGVGSAARALRMIETANRCSPGDETHYVGIDRFEGAHQLLNGKATRVQLLPGNPSETLARAANSLGKVDLLIVPEELESADSVRVWFFVPRMLHERSVVFVERKLADGQTSLRLKPREEIDRAATAGVRRAA